MSFPQGFPQSFVLYLDLFVTKISLLENSASLVGLIRERKGIGKKIFWKVLNFGGMGGEGRGGGRWVLKVYPRLWK